MAVTKFRGAGAHLRLLALEAQLSGSADEPKVDLDARYRKGLLYGLQVQTIDVAAHAECVAAPFARTSARRLRALLERIGRRQ